MSELTLVDIVQQLQEFKQLTEEQFKQLNQKVDTLSHEIKEVNHTLSHEIKEVNDTLAQEIKEVNHTLSQEIKEVKTAVEKLDSRLFELSMRIVTANSSAFFGVGIALLSAAIAFVVARISGGSGL